MFLLGGSRGAHGEESGRSGTRYGSHAPTPGDSTPSAPQTRTRRTPNERIDITPSNAAAPNTIDDVITSSKFCFFIVHFHVVVFIIYS